MKRNKVGHLIRTAVLLLLPLGAGAQAPAPRHSAEVAWGVSVPLGTGYPDKTGAAALRVPLRTAVGGGSLGRLGPYGRQRGVRRSLRRRRCNGLRRTHTAANPHHGHAAVVHARWAHKSVATLSRRRCRRPVDPVRYYRGDDQHLEGRQLGRGCLGRGRHTDLSAARGSSLPRRAGGLPLRFQPVEGRRSKRPARVLPVDRRGTELLKPRAQRPMHPNEPQEGQGPPKPKRPDEPQVSAGLPRRRAQEEIDDIDIHIP